jgi:hypothetical protein
VGRLFPNDGVAMPAKRISMRKIHDVLRLKWAAELSSREIAQATGIARSTVSDYLRRAEEAGLSWPLPDGLDHAALERVLFKQPERPTRARHCPIGPSFTGSCAAKASRSGCSGRSTARPMPVRPATPTHASASSTVPGGDRSMS